MKIAAALLLSILLPCFGDERTDAIKQVRIAVEQGVGSMPSLDAVDAIEKLLIPEIEKIPEADVRDEIKQLLKTECESRRKVFTISKEEKSLGVDRIDVIGSWRVRRGRFLRGEGAAKLFDAKDPDFRGGFAFASQTVESEWTLGVRCINELLGGEPRAPGTGYINEKDKPLPTYQAPPIAYLRGPKPLKSGESVSVSYSFSGSKWQVMKCSVMPDGCIQLRWDLLLSGASGLAGARGSDAVWFRFGEKIIKFNMKESYDVDSKIADFDWSDDEVKLPKPEVSPVPLPR